MFFNGELKQELEDAKSTIKSLEEKNNLLENSNTSLQQNLYQIEQKNSSLENELATLKSQFLETLTTCTAWMQNHWILSSSLL